MFFKSIRANVSFVSGIGVILSGLILGGFFIYNERNSHLERMKEKIINAAQVVTPQASYALERQDPIVLSQTIYALTSNGNFSYVEAIDSEGNVIAPIKSLSEIRKCRPNLSGGWYSTRAEGSEKREKPQSTGQLHFMRETSYDDLGRVYEGIFRVEDKNKILGYVAMGMNTQPIYFAMRKNITFMLVVMGIVLAGILGLSLVLARKTTLPVIQLSQAVSGLFQKISSLNQEDLDSLAVKNAPSEVDSLSSIMKKTFAQIISQEKNMQEQNRELAQSYEETQEELQTLLDAFRGIGQDLKFESVIRALIAKARSLVYCNGVAVILTAELDNEGIPVLDKNRQWDKRTLYVFLAENMASNVKLVSASVAEKVFNKDAYSYELIPSVQGSSYEGEIHSTFKSCCMFPILTSDSVPLGILFLGRTGEGPFEEKRLRQLSAVMEAVRVQLEKVFAHAEVEKMAKYDGLTGLLNHKTIREKLEEELRRAKRREETLYLVGLDIDHFKQINDKFGHENGDLVLKEFARIVSSNCVRREGEYAGRDGGEEFFVVLGNNTSKEEAMTIAKKIQDDVRNAEVKGPRGEIIKFTVSMGIAGYPRDSYSIEDLRDKTDRALYASKANGRNRFIFWDEGLESLNVVR